MSYLTVTFPRIICDSLWLNWPQFDTNLDLTWNPMYGHSHTPLMIPVFQCHLIKMVLVQSQRVIQESFLRVGSLNPIQIWAWYDFTCVTLVEGKKRNWWYIHIVRKSLFAWDNRYRRQQDNMISVYFICPCPNFVEFHVITNKGLSCFIKEFSHAFQI